MTAINKIDTLSNDALGSLASWSCSSL